MLQELIYKLNSLTEAATIPSILSRQISNKNETILEQQTCIVCMESKSLLNFQTHYNDDCTHLKRTICDDCMYDYVRNTWNLGTDITCPECSILLSHAAIEQISFNHGDTTLYKRYLKYDLDRILENNPEFVWCAHGCGSGQLNEGATMNNTVQCTNCHQLTCFHHRSPWHEGLTCDEYDMPRINGQEHASVRWIGEHTKKCPYCSSHIEKNEGCDHMTCLKCKHEFCWECLAPYSKIKRHGAYLHYQKCKHYPATETRTFFKRFIDLF